MFYIGEPNTKNTFSMYFLEHNQTDENVFLSIKYFQCFNWKYFTLGNYFTCCQTQPKREKKKQEGGREREPLQ